VVRWFGQDGNRYSKSFKVRKEAEWFAETKQPDVREGKADPPPQVSLRDFNREHGELMKGNLAPNTLHLHLATIGLLAESVGWDRQLEKISSRDIERFRADRQKTGIASSTANRELRTLKRIFTLAALRGYLPQGRNPCSAIPTLKVGRKRPPYCSPADFQAVVQRIDDPMWRAFLVTTYTTGMRLREALNLTWSDVDFGEEQISVTRKTSCKWVQAWTPKDHEMRAIPLPKQAVDLLAAWQAAAPEGCPYVFMEPGRWEYYRDHVSLGQWKVGQDLVNNLLRRFKTMCRKAGVGPYTIHDLRRSCITNWAKTRPIHVVQQLAGHSDIKTTQQFYLSVQPEDVKKAKGIQESVLGNILTSAPTDQLLTNSARKRVFPGLQGCQPQKEALE
jgi:integrase